ncbi:MAG: FecR domain-containing protein [Terracidiphilus sp.]
MKATNLVSSALFSLLLTAPAMGQFQIAQGKILMSSLSPSAMEGALLAAGAPDSSAFADGTRAINESRWVDAVNIFTYVAQQRNAHADGALYWKAYAQNKLGQTRQALETCIQLRHDFSSSSWVHECGALEIEIRARGGQPPQPKAEPDESLKLLALNEMMKRDEPRALAGLQEILSSDASERLKKEAQFILTQHYSDATYAQIVRVSYMEGDVRVERGEENAKTTGVTWEKAVANLPLETGYSLVTGEGRAEIEFEDTSTLYLGSHSVLLFSDMHTEGGVPYTELALLTGTVTLHVQPYVSGEVFILKTPTGRVTTVFPQKRFLRVGSYTDGMTLVEQKEAGGLQSAEGEQEASAPKPPIYFDGSSASWLPSGDPNAFAEWDKWVQTRVAERSAAIAEMMQISGLDEPIPGLAEMKGHGRFFACQPYGTCWEPSAEVVPPEADAVPPESVPQPAADHATASTNTQSTPKKAQSSGVGSALGLSDSDEDEFFPCFPLNAYGNGFYWGWNTESVDASYQADPAWRFYSWAVCHSGGWIHMHNRYVWVAGHRRHHLGPCHWIKHGHTLALVPIHPWDAKGRPPLNRKEEVLALDLKNGLRFERIHLGPTDPIKLLDEPPKEFNKAIFPVLARADEPQMEAFAVKDVYFASNAGAKGTSVKPVGIPLHFDSKSQNFTVLKQVVMGNRNVTVAQPLNSRSGTLQSRAGIYSGSSGSRSGGFNGGSGGGGYRGGSSGGYSGGGSRVGGGSSSASSSGGSHSGGVSSSAPSGGGAVSSGSSAASSASSSSVHH